MFTYKIHDAYIKYVTRILKRNTSTSTILKMVLPIQKKSQ